MKFNRSFHNRLLNGIIWFGCILNILLLGVVLSDHGELTESNRVKQSIILPDQEKSEIHNLFIKNYLWKKSLDPLKILEQRLKTLGFEDRIMEITPIQDNLEKTFRLQTFRIRLSPFPSRRLMQLFNSLEQESPGFYVETMTITRISMQSDDVDLSMNLLVLSN